eukprot:scaffold53716_cov67-Phaeocystis_antarctica.AAC.1
MLEGAESCAVVSAALTRWPAARRAPLRGASCATAAASRRCSRRGRCLPQTLEALALPRTDGGIESP